MNLPEHSNSTLTSRSFFINNDIMNMNKTHGGAFNESPSNDILNGQNLRDGLPPSIYLSTGYSTKQNGK